MSDDLHAVDQDVLAPAPGSSLAVAQAVLRAGDGSLPDLVGVGRSSPAFLLPTTRRVAASVCRSYNGLRPTRRRWQRTGVALALRAGAGSVVASRPADQGFALRGMPTDGSLLDELSRLLGTRVHVGVGLGVLDAYWKPVLQLFDGSGEPIGFAKVGWTPMTRRLVRTEWQMLEHLSGRLRAPLVPAPLVRTGWGPLDVVVTAPLPLDGVRLPGDGTAEVPESMSHLDGGGSGSLGELSWWDEVRSAVGESVAAGIPSVRTEGDADELVRTVEQLLAGTPLPVGLVHGDWVPWNQGRRRATGELVVWDWEYADPRAPLGLDAVHGRYQSERLLHGRTDTEAFSSVHRDVDTHLAALHAAMVLSRRCRAALLGADDTATALELAAAAAALRAALARAGGDSA